MSKQTWFDDRFGISGISKFLQKKEIPLHKHTIWYYTGSAILIFFGIQIVTGIMLAMYYKPTLELANESVHRIVTEIPMGWIVRSLHSWSATFMIAMVLIHLISIMLTKSYRKPREATWFTGVLLLVFSMAFGFTGYLLPWDDLSLAATKVGTDIPKAIPGIGIWVTKLLRGGEDVTGDTITRFFSIHISILPMAIFLLLAIHVYLIQRHGSSLPLDLEKKKAEVKAIPFWPNFIYREAMVWLVLVGALLTIAVCLPHPLGEPADLMAPAPEGIKPEWYFLFLFQTLKIFPGHVLFVSGETLAVLLILVAGMAFFFLPFIDNKPAEKKGRIITAVVLVFLLYAVLMSVWSLL